MDHTISTDTDRRRAAKPLVRALAAALVALLAGSGEGLAQQQILSGPLAKLDIKKAEIAPSRGKSEGTLTVAQHFALDPGWLNPLPTRTQSRSSTTTIWCMTR